MLTIYSSMADIIRCPSVAKHCPKAGEYVRDLQVLRQAVSKSMRLVCDPCETCAKAGKPKLPMWVKIALPAAGLLVLILLVLTIVFGVKSNK